MEKRIDNYIKNNHSHLPDAYSSGYRPRKALPIEKKIEISSFRRSVRKKLQLGDQICLKTAKTFIEDEFEKSLKKELEDAVSKETLEQDELEKIKAAAEKYRKHLSGTPLFGTIYNFFKEIQDKRGADIEIPLEDALMSAFGMFALKFPSLLRFDKKMKERLELANLKRVFGVSKVPSDTQMRDIIDPIDPRELRQLFKILFFLRKPRPMGGVEGNRLCL